MRTMSGSPCLHYDCSNRNSFGYCKTTVCINENYQQEQLGSQLTINKKSIVMKQPTNADRIRSMTDEELANFIGGIFTVEHDVYGDYDPHTVIMQEPRVEVRDKDEMLDWLKQESEG